MHLLTIPLFYMSVIGIITYNFYEFSKYSPEKKRKLIEDQRDLLKYAI